MKEDEKYLGRKLLGSLILSILIVIWLEIKWMSLVCLVSFLAYSCSFGEAWRANQGFVVGYYLFIILTIWGSLFFIANLVDSGIRSGHQKK